MADTNPASQAAKGQVTEADKPSQALKPPSYQARGTGRAFDYVSYQVGQSSYPDDLLYNAEYGGNYVVFYINVHQDSMLVRGNPEVAVDGALPPRLTGELRGLNISESTLDGAVAATAGLTAYEISKKADIGLKITQGAQKISGSNLKSTIASGVSKAIDVGVGVTAATVAVKTLGSAKREYKQLKQAIALHLPTDLAIRYGMQWEETDLAGTTAILAMAENFGGALKDAATFTGGNIADQIVAGGGVGANYTVAQGLNLPGVGQGISKTSGIAANPKKEQLFKQVDFRTFTFTYQFFPKSKEEAENVQEIIKLFKLHMHPEFKQDSYNFMYIYPSEFDIYYYHNGAENLNLHRHTSCVLTDMSVVYSPTGVTTMLPGGMPSQINITLTFKELAILTKENIMDGF